MALLNPTFLLGVVVLLYLSSFVVFAILRIFTGISIQRIGYLSLKRLAYTPKDGIRIEIRGLGIHLHRPTFAQPTWLSIVLSELAVSVDLKALESDGDSAGGNEGARADKTDKHVDTKEAQSTGQSQSSKTAGPQRSRSWETLNKTKERIKRLHRKINWLRMVDVVATNSSLRVLGVGNVQVGNFTLAVDTRRKMVDRSRMFQHRKLNNDGQRPAEWMLTIRSVLFTPEGKDSLEVMDHATLNVHGLLYQERDGLRDAAIALKLGRVHIPYDDLHECMLRFKACRQQDKASKAEFVEEHISVGEKVEGLGHTENRENKLTQTVNDSKEFASSILRGVKEVQFAVSYIGFATQVGSVKAGGKPVYINAAMKEIGVEVHRLDPKSPAHRMYFSPKDIAHQALVAALSVEVGVDSGQGKTERILYIPMSTTTIRTTLPSKTVETVPQRSADERNANMMFANVVITSLSIDLHPKHLPILLALIRRKSKANAGVEPRRNVLISRVLPKANVKFSMHEPVVRIALPPVEDTADPEDFDLIISSISSIALDVESSHSEAGDLHYSLCSTLRLQSHDLYYQTSSARRFDLLQTESMDLKVQVSATPEVYVVASGNLQTFSVHLNRPEISDGVRQIMNQLRLKDISEKEQRANASKNPNFIRALPPWLLHFQFQASDFSAEVSGVDEDISGDARGVALQLESWTAEYRAQRMESMDHRPSRRRTSSRSLTPDAELLKSLPPSPRKRRSNPTDGRRLAIHVRGLEGFVIDSKDEWEMEPFLAIPRFEVALSTSSDAQGPIFHLNSHVRTILLQYSLYRHYALGVAFMVLRTAFVQSKADEKNFTHKRFSRQDSLSPISPIHEWEHSGDMQASAKELLTIDVRVTLLQVKAQMPSDPPLMLQIYGMETGRHRWSPPFLHAKLVRLYAAAPKMRKVWARIASIKTAQIHLREGKKRLSSGNLQEENIIDVNTECIRLAVPHQLVLHNVFDNIVTTLKATEQLHHRFKTGTNDYILEKGPEGPKHVPRISLRSRALLFELEDGAFEWKLGTIYRAGQIEQQQRLAREHAFKVKKKKLEEAERARDPSRFRNRSAHPRGRSKQKDGASERSKSNPARSASRKRSFSTTRGRRMRYDPEGTSGLGYSAKISADEAWRNLQKHNAQSWKKRIDRVYDLSASAMKDIRGIFWGPDQLPDDMEETENILEVPQRPALMAALISDLHVTLGKPSFPMNKLAEFLHSVGKGMPRDMQYALLVPMHVQIDMGEARVTLRDYPLPLLHIPGIKSGQSARTPACSLKTDFVIAEEFRGTESCRYVNVDVIPPEKGNFSIAVRRTVSPVKSYSEINMDINTSVPTRITWGASYQPAIQDMMMVIETFTKPQLDPSDRTGFWDKIRLSFHSRVSVAWKGDGAVHLMLKGTKDPYIVTGNGAGFLMCWRNDVRLNVARDEDPRKFMTVDSGEYVLAIPDYSHQARQHEGSGRDDASVQTTDSYKNGAIFKKVVMKLSGNVQWLAGLMFERNVDNGNRSFDFEPHYNVVLKGPDYAKAPPGEEYDAYRGFRSHHIHMSIAVKAPVERKWSVTNTNSSGSYNAVHLTPRFFSHFFAWWSMFGGTMSLPIRQGALWPGIDKSSKKFGRHLATIKYNLLLAPLFISHIYKHKELEDYSEDVVSATGLKIRLDSFMLDMHQRREEFATQDRGRKTQGKTSGMKINRAQLDLLSADVRAISASIAGTAPGDVKKASTSTSLFNEQDVALTDLSSFNIPDNDFSWIDMDDFVELDWILPSEANPETQIMPLAFAPRFTYFRQTDRGDTISGDPDRTSPFGNEPTHFCIMSQDDDPRRVQCRLIKERLKQLERQISDHSRDLGAAELRRVQTNGRDQKLQRELAQLEQHLQVLREKKVFIESMYHRMNVRMRTNDRSAVPDGDPDVDSDCETSSPKGNRASTEGLDSNPAGDFVSDFDNRFVIHNMQMKWNNALRNIILRYIHQVGQRRGFVYYLSRRAVKFILDIVEEQNKGKSTSRGNTTSDPQTSKQSQTTNSPSSSTADDTGAAAQIQERINEILSDGKKFVNADDHHLRESPLEMSAENLASNIAKEFTPQNSYHLRLIAPQIQLQSEKNEKSVVLVTAKGMELKVIEVMDKDRISDSVSGLVQRRFSVEMDSTQFFVTQQKWFSSQLLTLYSGNHYGTPAGSAWPPWVPMEVMFDFKVDPFGFKRVVQKTSASLRYDKYNTLRLKYNDEISGDGGDASSPETVESRMDHLWVEFPQVRAICDSSQYYAMYIIVLDLLLYNEPLEKTRSERLEKIMLASDFSDLRGAPEMVIRLQERIRQLEELKTLFLVHSKYLDKKGWDDRLLLEQDLASCEDELFFMMKAITTSQRKYDGTQTSGLLRWNISSEQIVWHLMRDDKQPLMEFQLKNAEYDRTDNTDGSHINTMQIGRIVGLNLLPDAIYPEMIAPYLDDSRGHFDDGANPQMLRVYWYMLEAIAGIPVMDHFEVNLFPMKIQLEHEIGKKLFEYIFPGTKDKASTSTNASPFMIKHMQPLQDEDETEDSSSIRNANSSQHLSAADAERPESATNTRAGSLELRLRPTLTSEPRPHTANPYKSKAASLYSNQGSEGHNFRLFQSSKRSKSSTRPPSVKGLSKKASYDSLSSMQSVVPRQGVSRAGTSMTRDTSAENRKRFGLPKDKNAKKIFEQNKNSDDLTKMMSRASNYMTLAYVKIPSVVLCLSYKGKGERNLEDVHDFVFRLPMLEYRNKTWSNLDLALALKRDVIKALISHTGAIIGNKFSKSRPSNAQQTRLRELATSSMLLAPESLESSRDNSDDNTSSIFNTSPTDTRFSEHSKSPTRSNSRHGMALTRSPSGASSSINSSQSYGRRSQSFPMNMMMTPSNAASIADVDVTNSPGTRDSRAGSMANSLAESERLKNSGASTHAFDGEGGKNPSGFLNRLGHLGRKEKKDEEGEEGVRKKSVLLLGKKLLNGKTA